MSKVAVGTFTANHRMRELVVGVLNSGRLSYGEMSRTFEQEFARLHQCRYGVLSNSGTSSLQVALQAMKELHGWPDGTEVIVPAVTFVATVNVVLHNRMVPVLVDVEPNYYGLDVRQLEAAMTERTRAIMPVHLFGMPCNMVDVMTFAESFNLRVIEDSCECMFVGHNGRMAGSWGDIGCFSTYIAHLLTTGVGGIATTNNKTYAKLMRSLVNHGRDPIYISIDDDDPEKLSDKQMEQVVRRRLHFTSVGHSFRITELEAALAVAQLETWPDMLAKRMFNASYLTARLMRHERLQLPKQRPNTGHAYMMYPIVYDAPKWELVHFLEDHEIETRDMLPLTSQPVYHTWFNEDEYPVAQRINECGFYIGCHQDLTLDDLDYVCAVFKKWFVK